NLSDLRKKLRYTSLREKERIPRAESVWELILSGSVVKKEILVEQKIGFVHARHERKGLRVIAGRFPGGRPLRRRRKMVAIYGQQRLRGPQPSKPPSIIIAARQGRIRFFSNFMRAGRPGKGLVENSQ